MSASDFAKKNISGMQVIKTLQVLLEGSYTMSELVDILNRNEEDQVFNNNVISKYINTCRYCGFNIIKIHNKYILTKIPFGLEFSLREIELIEINSIKIIMLITYNLMTSVSVCLSFKAFCIWFIIIIFSF